MIRPQIVLILGSVWPEPQSSAAGVRMVTLIRLFLDQGWKVTYGSAAADSDHCADLEKLAVDKVKIELNNSAFDSYVRQLNPSIVVFDRFMVEEQFGWRVAEQCPDALRVLNTEDLHCLRRLRQKAFKESRQFEARDLLTSDVAKREVASILRSDLSLIISDHEIGLLRNLFGIDESLLHYLPFMESEIDDGVTESWPSYDDRQHFITIGNFLHEPNSDSVVFLKEEVWPLVRKSLPAAELHIYGAYPIPRVMQLHNAKERFYIKGRANDVKEVMTKARVCLAPLRFGAGLKGKLLDSMLCGTPSVTTSIGAEAMHGNFDWNGLIADDAVKISEAAVELYTNKTAWLTAQANGIRIVNCCYRKEILAPKLLERISLLQARLELHRQDNFAGAMLMHHTMASTKFMSRWIEAKNKQPKVEDD